MAHPPCLWLKSEIFLDVMKRTQIDLGAQDLNDIQRPNSFQKKELEVKFLTSTTTPTEGNESNSRVKV
jgi:hypothetical protein